MGKFFQLPTTYYLIPIPNAMKLREKTLLVIGVTLIGLVGFLYATASTIMIKHVRDLEREHTADGVKRALNNLSENLADLRVPVRQLAAWDDTYAFMQNKNDDYIENNLSKDTFLDYNLNLALLIDRNGRPLFSKSFDLKSRQLYSVPSSLSLHLKPGSLLLQHSNPKDIHKGIILLPESPVLIYSHPILTSNFQGPIRGTMIVGRYLSDRQIKRLEKTTQLSVNYYRTNDPELPPEFKTALSALISRQVHGEQFLLGVQDSLNGKPIATFGTDLIIVQPLSENAIAGYTLLKDIYSQPAIILQVKFNRIVYNQGKISLLYLLFSLIGVGLVFGAATLLLLEKLVLSRLTRLSYEVKNIGNRGDASLRVSPNGNDELYSLASTINWMLEELEFSLKALKMEREKADNLLLNILPESIAQRLKKEPSTIAENFAEATVLFADIVGFTKMSSQMSPVEMVNLLNKIFSAFDRLVEQHGLEKIKTIGDAYMVVGGIPNPRADHVQAVAEMALGMLSEIERFNAENKVDFSMRIGINTGPVVAGVIGIKKFIYDLWGDTVNIASRMESHGLPGCIQVSEATYQCLQEKYEFEERGVIQVKGRGEMITYLLLGRME